MTVHFYLEGDFTPVAYDYDISLAGALIASSTQFHRTENLTIVVLKKAERGSTAAQLQRIASLKAAYPDLDMHFHFSTVSRAIPAPRRKRHPVAVVSDKLAGLIRRAIPA